MTQRRMNRPTHPRTHELANHRQTHQQIHSPTTVSASACCTMIYVSLKLMQLLSPKREIKDLTHTRHNKSPPPLPKKTQCRCDSNSRVCARQSSAVPRNYLVHKTRLFIFVFSFLLRHFDLLKLFILNFALERQTWRSVLGDSRP